VQPIYIIFRWPNHNSCNWMRIADSHPVRSIHISCNGEHPSWHSACSSSTCISYMHACLCKLITRQAQLSRIVRWTKAQGFASQKICVNDCVPLWYPIPRRILFCWIDIPNWLLSIAINRIKSIIFFIPIS